MKLVASKHIYTKFMRKLQCKRTFSVIQDNFKSNNSNNTIAKDRDEHTRFSRFVGDECCSGMGEEGLRIHEPRDNRSLLRGGGPIDVITRSA